MLKLSDIAIIMTRLFLETLSYYNAKFMYALKGASKISPIFTLYITHSMGSLILINDLIVHKLKYPNHVAKETGLKFSKLLMYVAFLSLFYNLCHIPKFYAMNYMSDVSIVSIYSASVLFTYVFSVIIISKRVVKKELCWVIIGFVGIIVMGNDTKRNALWASVVISSMFSGLYGVLFKVVMNKGSEKINFYQLENSASGSDVTNEGVVDRSKKIEYDDKIVIHEEDLSSKLTETDPDITERPESVPSAESFGIPEPENFINQDIKYDMALKADTDDKQKRYFLSTEISDETYRRVQFMKHYISLTGLFTLLFYWPGLWFVDYMQYEDISFPLKPRPIIHVLVANVVSLSHNLMYFIIVAARTPLFAQISGIILQPTFLFISILQKKGIACMGELVGCIMSFLSFLFLCSSEV